MVGKVGCVAEAIKQIDARLAIIQIFVRACLQLSFATQPGGARLIS